MDRKTKIIVGVLVVLVLGTAAAIQANRGRTRGIEVADRGSRAQRPRRGRDPRVVTSARGARSDVSSDVSAKVAELLIDEGENVVRGQLLLRLEPDQYQAALSRNEASLAQAEAQQTQQEGQPPAGPARP